MGHYPLNNSFTRQFREEPVLHFNGEAMQSNHLLFQMFGTSKTDTQSLSQWLAPRLHDEAIIYHLQDKLTKDDMPGTERLYAFVQETSRELADQAQAEPYTAHYYDHLIALLRSFLDLIDAFTMNGLQLISGPSTASFTAEDNRPANSEAVSNVYSIIEDYMYQIMEYFQHFDMLLQKESDSTENNARVLVRSYVAHYLDTILHHMEQLISNTDSTLEMLHAWETALQNREEQELYN